jgi:hypothetical protein
MSWHPILPDLGRYAPGDLLTVRVTPCDPETGAPLVLAHVPTYGVYAADTRRLLTEGACTQADAGSDPTYTATIPLDPTVGFAVPGRYMLRLRYGLASTELYTFVIVTSPKP